MPVGLNWGKFPTVLEKQEIGILVDCESGWMETPLSLSAPELMLCLLEKDVCSCEDASAELKAHYIYINSLAANSQHIDALFGHNADIQ